MSDSNYLWVRVIREQPIPFNGEEMAPMFRACIVEQRAFLTGNKFVTVATLAYEQSEAEAKRKAAALLRQWANAVEFVDRSGGDPKLCSYCGQPKSSFSCQANCSCNRCKRTEYVDLIVTVLFFAFIIWGFIQ